MLQVKVIRINSSYTTIFNRRLVKCLLSLLHDLSGASAACGRKKHSDRKATVLPS